MMQSGTISANIPAVAQFPLRWIVLFTGQKATDDYEPTASLGSDPALVQEVTEVSLAFHPHTEIRMFPQNGDALLFYRAKTAPVWILTRVTTAPNPDGVRTSLEYAGLVLSDEDLRQLGGDPFAICGGRLLDAVRREFLSGSRDAVTASTATPLPDDSDIQKTLAPMDAATPENLGRLARHVAARASERQPVPSFATWWPSSNPVPEGYFDVVLRTVASRALSLRDVTAAVAALAVEIKAALPNTPTGDAVLAELTRNILAGAEGARQAISLAGSGADNDSPALFRDHLAVAERFAAQTTVDIDSLVTRVGTTLSAAQVDRLKAIADHGRDLARDLPRVRHPNPFARARVDDESLASEGVSSGNRSGDEARPSATSSSRRRFALAGILLSLAVVITLLSRRAIPPPISVRQSSSALTRSQGGGLMPPANRIAPASTGVPLSSGVGVTPNPAAAASGEDSAHSVLARAQSRILPIAQTAARGVARRATESRPAPPTEATIEKFAAGAINKAYRGALTTEAFAAVFPGSAGWSYAQYRRDFPALAYAVHEEARVGAVEGIADRRIEAAGQAVSQPGPPRETSSRRTGAGAALRNHATHALPVAPPEKVSPIPAGPPKGGSAAENGL